jgi:threonyl-tRNA synthetase
MVIGEKDLNQVEPSFTVRVRKTNEEESMQVWQINQAIQSQIKGKPYSSLNAPMLLSKRPVIQV